MRSVIVIGVLFSIGFVGCSTPEKKIEVESKVKEYSEANILVTNIEEAHKKALFNSFEAIQFDLNLTFGGKERFNGRIYMNTDGSKIKMEDASSMKLWDGKKAMILPDTSNNMGARFGLLTWSYFFAAPYKLSDEGTKHEYLAQQPLLDETYEANRLTFDNGIGDAPDDWYVVYKDNNSDYLAALAYIVTGGGTSVEEAEKDPHAITYEAYAEVRGIPFATQWNFWSWNEKGELNKLLGNATVSNIELIKKAGDLFDLTAISSSVIQKDY